MYDTKFECRYHKDDVFLDTDQISDEEKEYIRDILYKEDLLNIFFIDFDDCSDIFESVISKLYNKIKDYLPFKNCMKKFANFVMSEEEKTGLIIMYSYDYMYITHKCVSEYLDTDSLSQENIELLDKISK